MVIGCHGPADGAASRAGFRLRGSGPLAEFELGDGAAVDFVRTVDDAHRALVGIGLGQPEVLR